MDRTSHPPVTGVAMPVDAAVADQEDLDGVDDEDPTTEAADGSEEASASEPAE